MPEPTGTFRAGAFVLSRYGDRLPTADESADWARTYAQLLTGIPGCFEYRQLNLAQESATAWPSSADGSADLVDQGRINEIAELTFTTVLALARRRAIGWIGHRAEQDVFVHAICATTRRSGARWYSVGSDRTTGARSVVLLRRHPLITRSEFRHLVDKLLATALADSPDITELRTFAFSSPDGLSLDSTRSTHGNPSDRHPDAAMIVGAADRRALEELLAGVVSNLSDQITLACSVARTYHVERTVTYVRSGRTTLPQISPQRRPRLEPIMRRDIPLPPERALRRLSTVPFPTHRLLPLGGRGPEDVIADHRDRLILGVNDGRILRLDVESGAEETIGATGGRPLGLELLDDGRVLICDAHRGLLRLEPDTGDLEVLVHTIDTVPLRFCSNAAAAQDGTIWFTESTNRFDFEYFRGALLEHRPSGRLFRRAPDGEVEIVLDQLHFANGIALTEDESALLFAETGAARISRMEIATREVSVVADNLPGYPDNLSSMQGGRVWVAMPTPRNPALERLATRPRLLRKVLWRVPERMLPRRNPTTWLIAVDDGGKIVEDFQSDLEGFGNATGAVECRGRLFVASPHHPALLEVALKPIAQT